MFVNYYTNHNDISFYIKNMLDIEVKMAQTDNKLHSAKISSLPFPKEQSHLVEAIIDCFHSTAQAGEKLDTIFLHSEAVGDGRVRFTLKKDYDPKYVNGDSFNNAQRGKTLYQICKDLEIPCVETIGGFQVNMNDKNFVYLQEVLRERNHPNKHKGNVLTVEENINDIVQSYKDYIKNNDNKYFASGMYAYVKDTLHKLYAIELPASAKSEPMLFNKEVVNIGLEGIYGDKIPPLYKIYEMTADHLLEIGKEYPDEYPDKNAVAVANFMILQNYINKTCDAYPNVDRQEVLGGLALGLLVNGHENIITGVQGLEKHLDMEHGVNAFLSNSRTL